MRVARIRIDNVLGIEHIEVEPGRLTVVEGGNGQGKTSVLEAIKAVFRGGHDASLIRNGADRAEVVLVLEDGTEILKRITPDKSSVDVRHPEMGRVSRPQTVIDGLVDALSVNPIAFLTAPPAKRAEWLLEAMPIEVTAAEIREAVGDALRFPPTQLQGHGLTVIDRMRRAVYDERTGVNRAAKEKRATAEQLRESLPAERASPDELQARVDEIRAEGERISREKHDRLLAIEQRRSMRTAALLEERDRRIREIEAEYAAKAQAVNDETERERQAVIGEVEPRLAEIRDAYTRAQEQLRTADRDANTRQVVEQMEGEVAQLEERSRALTQALARLDALKLGLLQELPIPGLEVRDGDIYRDGVPFDRLNRAQQVQIAIDVARLRAGRLGLVCVDGLECLDRETFDAFCEQAAASDLQLIVSRVTEGELDVRTVEPAGAEA